VKQLTVVFFVFISLIAIPSAASATTAKAWIEKGDALVKTGNYDTAIHAYTKAIEIDPQSKSAYQTRAYVFEKLKNYQQCVSDFTRMIELEPQSALWYSERARGYFSLKQYAKAFEDLGKAIELDPDNDRAYSKRAGFYTRLNKHEEAIADYTEAIELKPDYKFHYFSRGKAAEKISDFCQAVNDYTNAIELDPQDHYSYGRRAEINMKIGNYQEAVDDFTRVIELKKNSKYIYMTYRKRYNAYEKLQKHDLAVEDLKAAAGLGDLMSKDKLKKIGILSPTVTSPKTADDWNDLAMNFLDSKKYREAVEAYTSAIELDPEKPFYYSGRAYAYISLQQDQRAADDLTTAIETGMSGKSKIDRSSASRLYSWRARAYIKIGKYREAAADFSKQLELTKHPRSSLYRLRARSYENAGMMEEAIEDLQIAARLGNKYAKARLRKETIQW